MIDRIRQAGTSAWAVVGLAALLALVGLICWYIRVVWPPLILAGAIVFLLNPIVTALQNRRVPRVLGTTIAYAAVAAVLGGTGLLIAPLAINQYEDLADEWPDIRDNIESTVDDTADWTTENDFFIQIPTYDELEDFISGDSSTDADGDGVISSEERQERLFDQLDTAREVALSVFHVGIIFILAPIIAFYLLVDLPHVRRVMESLVPRRARGDVMVVARRLNRAIGGYFRGQLAVAAIVGAMVSVGLAIIDLPFWLIVGIIAGVFNMIPLIGPWVGAVPGIIIALTTRDFTTALWVAGIMAGAQQIDNHFISPIVMQRAVKLHPAVVMLALLAGGTLGGFFGLLLAVPTAAVLKIVIGHAWRHFVLEEPLDELEARWSGEDAEPGVGSVRRVGTNGDDPDLDPDAEVEASPT